MRNRILLVLAGVLLFVGGYSLGYREPTIAFAQTQEQKQGIPKAYGHVVGIVSNMGGTAFVFEGSDGTIRLVGLKGQMMTEIARY